MKTINWRKAWAKARKTAKWAVTMTKVRIRKTISKTRWQLITFLGPMGGESVGIIDLMAIRKSHAAGKGGLKRGDAFEIILIQVKGGVAPFPTDDEIKRLRLVGEMYRAKAVLLAQWKRGAQVDFYCLETSCEPPWQPLASLKEIFH